MRYILLALIAACSLFITPAFAAAPYDDVPTDHWAYSALDYLSQQGVLEGYPQGYFSGDKALSRFEFTQAIAKLVEQADAGNASEQIKIMVDTLRAEFSEQLNPVYASVAALQSQAEGLEGRLSDVEGIASDNAVQADALAAKLAGLKPGPAWAGSLRYRWQFDDFRDHQRFRQRFIFQFGFNKKINEAVEAGMRFKTITGVDPVGSLQDLGNNLKSPSFYLDRAYVKYTPGWFGRYTDKDSQPVIPRVEVYAGIYPNPLTDPNAAILDSDVNQQGLGVVYHFNSEFQIVSVASVALENSGNKYFSDDAYFLATELKRQNLLRSGLDAWLGCYSWKGASHLPDGSVSGSPNDYANNMLSDVDLNGDGVINGLDRFSSDFTTIKAGLQYTFQCEFKRPLRVFSEYVANIDSDAKNRIQTYNAGQAAAGQELVYESSDDSGYVIGAQYGADPVAPGEWSAFARYKEMGANAILHGFGDNVTGGANRNGLELTWNYVWAENSALGITYYLVKMNNALGRPVPENMADRKTLQIDWVFKF
jgi:hypothetical protein